MKHFSHLTLVWFTTGIALNHKPLSRLVSVAQAALLTTNLHLVTKDSATEICRIAFSANMLPIKKYNKEQITLYSKDAPVNTF